MLKFAIIVLLTMMMYCVQSKPMTGSRLSRQKRTIGDFPISFGRISLLGLRVQVFPHAPFGATNLALFDVDVVVPKELAFLVPGKNTLYKME